MEAHEDTWGKMGHLDDAPEESFTGKTRKQPNKERLDLKLL
jgi:hypothetical protein